MAVLRMLLICAGLALLLGLCAGAESAAGYRKLADRCVACGAYAQAATYYRKEAAIYRRIGDHNAAKVEEMKAERWTTEVELFIDAPPSDDHTYYTGAKFEPVYGCYFGTYLRRYSVDVHTRGVDPVQRFVDTFTAHVGKKPATCFTYRDYGQPFPLAWAQSLDRLGIAPHIAWEPNKGLARVKDDDYLHGFARDAAKVGGPVFLRFASEMNGDWARYGGNPRAYIAAFRRVHDVMAKLAPNVAMIWCVNHVPEHTITAYYPGDAYVDWVGVNFYSVYYHDNNRNRPAWHECPTSMLKFIYHTYAAKKPIAVCEYGATHMASLDRVPRPEFAIAKFSRLYAALPRLFPRVKMINIFNYNTIVQAVPGRQLNNYMVTDDEHVCAAFAHAVAPAYFLTGVQAAPAPEMPPRVVKLAPESTLAGMVDCSAWVKTYEDTPRVVYTLDDTPLADIRAPGTYRARFDASALEPGLHRLAVTVYDTRGREAGKREMRVRIAPPPPAENAPDR